MPKTRPPHLSWGLTIPTTLCLLLPCEIGNEDDDEDGKEEEEEVASALEVTSAFSL